MARKTEAKELARAGVKYPSNCSARAQQLRHHHQRLRLRNHRVKDYGHLLPARPNSFLAGKGHHRIRSRKRGSIRRKAGANVRITYHSACSLQHGQRVRQLLAAQIWCSKFPKSRIYTGRLAPSSSSSRSQFELEERKLTAIGMVNQYMTPHNIGCITQAGVWQLRGAYRATSRLGLWPPCRTRSSILRRRVHFLPRRRRRS